MKVALFFFILGLAVGGYGMYRYQESQGVPPSAAPAKEKLDQKLVDWHLTKNDIQADLDKTGSVVRTKAAQAGSKIADARIHAVIKAKYVLDRDLYGDSNISISVDNGAVSLTGSVPSEDEISKAVGLAMDTDGVTVVTAKLTVKPKST
jgi:hypothetical protein